MKEEIEDKKKQVEQLTIDNEKLAAGNLESLKMSQVYNNASINDTLKSLQLSNSSRAGGFSNGVKG